MDVESTHIISENNCESIADLNAVQYKIRRSSLFKPYEEETLSNYSFSQFNQTGSSTMTYTENLQNEIIAWKNFYSSIKNEYQTLKNLKQNEFNDMKEFSQQVIALYENVVTRIDDFILHVNNVLKMHEHLIDYYNMRLEQLSFFKTNLSKKIHKKIKL